MVGWSSRNSRREIQEEKPCVCKDTCPCHKPSKETLFPLVIPFAFPFMFPFIFPGLFIIIIAFTNKPSVKHIEINGQDCIVEYHQDGASSTGASYGHEVANCQK